MTVLCALLWAVFSTVRPAALGDFVLDRDSRRCFPWYSRRYSRCYFRRMLLVSGGPCRVSVLVSGGLFGCFDFWVSGCRCLI